MASLIHVGGGGKIYRSDGSGIILKLDDFGTVNVSYGGVEMGQGLHAALRQMVAEALGVKPGGAQTRIKKWAQRIRAKDMLTPLAPEPPEAAQGPYNPFHSSTKRPRCKIATMN